MTSEGSLVKGKDYIGVGVGAIIFNDDGKVFLNKRGKKARNESGKWEFPGGGVRFGEKLADALKREVREEFDIEIEVLEQLITEDHILEDEGQHWVSPTFIARHVSGEPRIMEPEKCDDFKWVDLEEIKNYELSVITQSDLETYLIKFGDGHERSW
jgi:8-oxo-dGTP diphosphatase